MCEHWDALYSPFVLHAQQAELNHCLSCKKSKKENETCFNVKKGTLKTVKSTHPKKTLSLLLQHAITITFNLHFQNVKDVYCTRTQIPNQNVSTPSLLWICKSHTHKPALSHIIILVELATHRAASSRNWHIKCTQMHIECIHTDMCICDGSQAMVQIEVIDFLFLVQISENNFF